METTKNKSRKIPNIIYWVSTLWLSLGMTATAIVQLMHSKSEVDKMNQLGYPVYFLTVIGTWKVLGVIAILTPKFPLVKEWAYAGFFIAMSGAVYSHVAVGNGFIGIYGPLLLLVLTVISWYYRPASRKITIEPAIV